MLILHILMWLFRYW